MALQIIYGESIQEIADDPQKDIMGHTQAEESRNSTCKGLLYPT